MSRDVTISTGALSIRRPRVRSSCVPDLRSPSATAPATRSAARAASALPTPERVSAACSAPPLPSVTVLCRIGRSGVSVRLATRLVAASFVPVADPAAIDAIACARAISASVPVSAAGTLA